MNKKSMNKKLISGGALVLGTVLSAACFPVMAGSPVSAAIDDDKTIYLLQAGNSEVNVGNSYTIRTAYFGGDEVPVGLASYTQPEVKASSVTVTYLSTGKNVTITKDSDDNIKSEVAAHVATEMTYGTFPVEYVGAYRINYSITVNDGVKDVVYQTHYDVTGVVNDASMSFESNQSEVLPKVYDLGYDKVKNSDGNQKAVVIPLPNVFDAKEEMVDEVKYYRASDAVANEDTNYVVVSAYDPNGTEVALSKTDDGRFYIAGTEFATTKLGTYTISYKYYVKEAGSSSATAQCLSTTKKKFEVKNGYYNDYELKASISKDVSTFVTGVESDIPTISATATFKNSTNQTSNEEQNIHYTVAVKYSADKSTYVDTEDAVVNGKFTPSKNGQYKFTFTATDFYGNTAEFGNKVIEASDTQAPDVYIYDASDVKNYTDNDLTKAISAYASAESKLNTKSSQDNVVIYAIGATDNYSKLENINLTRTITNQSSATIKIDNVFNEYNLVFNYDYSKVAASNSLFARTLKENSTDAATADAWLKEHKFLKVVYSADGIDTGDVVKDKTADGYDEDALRSKLLELGYAFVNATHTISGSTAGTSYTITYSGKDEFENSKTLDSKTMTIYSNEDDFEITEEPTISISTSFQQSYTTKDVITFAEPTVTSSLDSNPDVVTTYQFKDSVKADIAGYAAVTLEDEYKIDLSTAPVEAAYVQIKVVATTDYGTTTTYTKDIEISDIKDNQIPTAIADTTSISGAIKQGEEVELPTIVYEDDYVAIMNARVEVYNLDATGNRIHTLFDDDVLLSYSRLEGKATFRKHIVAEFAGDYEILVVASDPANNIITSYYYFTAAENEQHYAKLNVPSAINGDGTAKVGETIVFDVPTVTYKLASGEKVYGLLDVDSTKTSDTKSVEYFSIDPTEESVGVKKTSETTFTFEKAGIYKFKYTANVGITTDAYIATNFGGVVNDYLKTKSLESVELTITVTENTEAKTYSINFGDGEYKNSVAKDTEIAIYGIGADENVDIEKSTITISYSGPTSSTKTYKLSDFSTLTASNFDANGNIKYKLTGNGTYTITYKVVDVNGSEYTIKDGQSSSYTIRVGDYQKPEVAFDEGFVEDTYALNEELTLDVSKIVLSDNGVSDDETRTSLLSTMKVTLSRKDDNGNWIAVTNIGDEDSYIYKYKLDTAGEYKLTVSVKDSVKWEGTNSTTFTVSTEGKSAGISTKTIGTILIVLSALVLAGVIAYFVISRVRLNKKGTKKASKKNDKK